MRTKISPSANRVRCHLAQLDPELFGDLFGEPAVGGSGEELESPEHTWQKVHSVSA